MVSGDYLRRSTYVLDRVETLDVDPVVDAAQRGSQSRRRNTGRFCCVGVTVDTVAIGQMAQRATNLFDLFVTGST